MIKGNLQQNEMALFLIQSTLAAAPAQSSNHGGARGPKAERDSRESAPARK